MTGRERIINAANFRATDTLPLRIYAAAGGLYEHGQKLVDLIKECGHDFGDFNGLALPAPPEDDDLDSDGRYHATKVDEWGTTWEYRNFGIWGHPVAWPLDDLKMLDTYAAPSPPEASGASFKAAGVQAHPHRQEYYLLGEGGSVFEKLHSLRRFEEVVMAVTLSTLEIERIADLIVENVEGHVCRSLALDADGIAFADDFKEVGVDVLWPQLPLYELSDLRDRCRELGIALELHPDRGELMQQGTPDDVRAYLRSLVDTFNPLSGGSWLYIEIDPGFPWENVKALFETAMDMRT